MNREDTIRMALEAGMLLKRFDVFSAELPDLERFFQAAYAAGAAAEREACAIVCDDINAKYKLPDDAAERVASQWCADAIRARGQT